jgi:hypothetical protein
LRPPPALGDFDGDGTLDLAIAGCDRVEIYTPSRAAETYQLASTFELGLPDPTAPMHGRPYSLVAADVDGDGRTDLLASRSQSRLGLWRGQGDGTFAPTVVLAQLPDQPWQLFVEDIDGDGHPDVVTQGRALGGGGDATVEVLLGAPPSGAGGALHVYAPLLQGRLTGDLVAVTPAPHAAGKGTFVLRGASDELHLVTGACQ